MHKLLIVDDEQPIVDWLHGLFSELVHLDLDIAKATNGREVLSLLRSTRIDVVLADIRMPEMDGLQLMKAITEAWPDCKVVFLTGYSEFEYVYAAIQRPGVRYLLKTEEDAQIIKAVEDCIREIEEGYGKAAWIDAARRKIGMAMPLLQQEYLTALLQGDRSALPVLQDQLRDLELPLDAGRPLLALLGRVDDLPPRITRADRSRILYDMRNAVEHGLPPGIPRASVMLDALYTLWLAQPEESSWERARLVIKESLETVQATCREALHVGMSFAFAREACRWEELAERYRGLRQLLNGSVGSESSVIISGADMHALLQAPSGAAPAGSPFPPGTAAAMEICLEQGQQTQYFELFAEMKGCLEASMSMRHVPALEAFFSLSLRLLSSMSRWGIVGEVALAMDVEGLTHADRFSAWGEAADYLRRVSLAIFRARSRGQEERGRTTVSKIKRYIMGHLSEDISLAKLADLAYFNPSYLSRLFKQVTGTNLSEHIQRVRLERALELLADPGMKVQDIAAAVGFASPAYFARFFKKITHLTPQEYRDASALRSPPSTPYHAVRGDLHGAKW
jgi:two-component system, response regulator YesN